MRSLLPGESNLKHIQFKRVAETVGIVFTEEIASLRKLCKPIGQSSRSRKYPFLGRRIATGLYRSTRQDMPAKGTKKTDSQTAREGEAKG